MKRLLFATTLIPFVCFSQMTENEALRRVQAHLMIDDPSSALRDAAEAVRLFPNSRPVAVAWIEALAAKGFDDKAFEAWNLASIRYPDLIADRHLLEELSWGVLKKGLESTQYGVRLASLVGSYLTQDVRAVPILLRMMRDSNAVVRSVAIQMAASYQDAPLKDEITKLMELEKIWMVRLEVIRAAGALRMKELSVKLKSIVQSDKTTYEERAIAIQALVQIYDDISIGEWNALAASNRAGMRHLACSIASHFSLPEAKEGICRLLRDPHPDVRVAALNAFGLCYRKQVASEEAKKLLQPALEDANPQVAITASWAAMLIDVQIGESHFKKWIEDSLPENRRLAAAALSATGSRGAHLAANFLKKSEDYYVKANLALGLIGQREEISSCCDILFHFLQTEKRMWMWDNRPNPLFQILAPSQVRHVDHIPNYPEAIDQMTRLNLVSMLALVDDPRALEALKTFLQKRSWGITGVAAATLLQEGDDTSLEVVRQLLQDPDPDVRLEACLVLAMMGRDDSVLRNLHQAYLTSDHDRKLHILEAMGRVGNQETFPFLVSVFKEPFPILRIAAAAALIQSLNR